MKKFLVILVCLVSSLGTMSIKAQDGNLTPGQWNHGLAVGAQWIATDLRFGKAESEVIKKTSENYSLDDLKGLYGKNSKWAGYYDKLKSHENETGNVDKLVSTITSAYNSSIKAQVKRDIEKYNGGHSGDEVATTPSATGTTDASTGGANVVAAGSTGQSKAAAAAEKKEEGGHGGHGFLYFLSLLGLALGALGTFLAFQARKESQAIIRDANDDIKNLQKQIDKLRAVQKQNGEVRKQEPRREARTEAKTAVEGLAQAKKIDFDSKDADKKETKPVERKIEPKKEEPKKVEPKREEPKPATFSEPRILFMAKPDEKDNFSRSASAYEPGNSIFELTTMDGKSGSFTVINKSDAHKLALLMPGDTLARACSGNNIQSTAGKSRIITDRAGRAQLENGMWHIVVKAIVHYE